MKMKISAALVALALLPQLAFAQSKAETKLYQKTVSKPSVAAFDKFLKKYPTSVYAAEIQAKKDTLLIISPYSLADAEQIASGFMEGYKVKAQAWRTDGVDHISGVGFKDYECRYMLLEKGKDAWTVTSDYGVLHGYIKEDSHFEFVDSTYVVKIAGLEYLRFNRLAEYASGDSLEYVAHLFCPKEDYRSCSLWFIGKKLADGTAEGRIADGLEPRMDTPQMIYLKSELQKVPGLYELPMSTILTDESIKWWLDSNPDALTTARSIRFGLIPEESSLAQTYESMKKESSQKYRAAMFDIRDYTVVVVYDRSSGKYILAWAEPECKDHKNGRLLNNIYFEDGSTLVLFYYHGKKTFKYRLNLSSKSLRR
ncbi:MAG: hypothetical protein Q4F39_05835 [Bacteroidia bacterium]|nr:hypothetical protein [Bacteroidia bacterium]